MDRPKFQYEGIKWLFELELLNHPQAINHMKMNILMVSKRIKEVELLIYRENKSMLILLDLTWFGRKFSKQKIFTDVHEVLHQLLPSFRFRVTDDPKIMDLAVERVKKALTGGQSEKGTTNGDGAVQQPSKSVIAVGSTETDGSGAGSETNPQEPSQDSTDVRPLSGASDSSKE